MLCISGFVDDVMFEIMERRGQNERRHVRFVELAKWRHRGEVAVYDCRLFLDSGLNL